VPVLPSLATSSIGSLPHTQLELALQQALLVDIPAAPQLPRRDPAEYMVAQALDGLPGLHAEPDGTATLDAAEWTRGAATFDARLERTLEKGEGRESFLPTAASWQALRPFLWEVEQRKLPFAKVQIAGCAGRCASPTERRCSPRPMPRRSRPRSCGWSSPARSPWPAR